MAVHEGNGQSTFETIPFVRLKPTFGKVHVEEEGYIIAAQQRSP